MLALPHAFAPAMPSAGSPFLPSCISFKGSSEYTDSVNIWRLLASRALAGSPLPPCAWHAGWGPHMWFLIGVEKRQMVVGDWSPNPSTLWLGQQSSGMLWVGYRQGDLRGVVVKKTMGGRRSPRRQETVSLLGISRGEERVGISIYHGFVQGSPHHIPSPQGKVASGLHGLCASTKLRREIELRAFPPLSPPLPPHR